MVGLRRNTCPDQQSGGNYLAFNWSPAINLTPYPTINNQCPGPFLSWQDCHTFSFGCHSYISHFSHHSSFPSSNGSASLVQPYFILYFLSLNLQVLVFFMVTVVSLGSLIWYILLDLLILFCEDVQVPGLVSLVHPCAVDLIKLVILDRRYLQVDIFCFDLDMPCQCATRMDHTCLLLEEHRHDPEESSELFLKGVLFWSSTLPWPALPNPYYLTSF